MSVYVDPLFETAHNPNWPYDEACHMMADSIDELNKFAIGKLKLKAGWIQVTSIVHYDLTKGKRFQAIKHGAIEVDDRFRPETYKKQVEEMKNGIRRSKSST